ncbi:MAG: CRISPR-associated helicase Cas3' [Oscillospiraceae bacterium]
MFQHCVETGEIARKHGEICGIPNLAEAAAINHDTGKFTGRFNGYIHGDNSVKRGEIDHSYAGAKFVSACLADTNIKGCVQAAELIGHAIVSHHGLHDWCNKEHLDYYSERIGKNEDYEEVLAEINRVFDMEKLLRLMAEGAGEYIGIINKVKEMTQSLSNDDRDTARAFYMGMTERLLESILIDADRTNTAEFMSGKVIERNFDLPELWEKMDKNLKNKLTEFSAKTDSISAQRRSISDRCFKYAEKRVGICKLIVPTGGGKTLSSLRFAIEYCKRNNMEKIIYIAPFMSILEQNSDHIRELAGDDCFLEHYSDAMQQKYEKLNENEYHDYELRTELWDSPVIATTMVQFLNTLFSDKTSSVRRMHRLSRAVIIIDEVQSVPRKCIYPFNLAMNFLSKICGASIVLCSATQPPFETMPKFPILLDENSSMTGDTKDDFDVFARTKIIPKLQEGKYTYSQAADFTAECLNKNGSVLFVTNTKEAAKEIYSELKRRISDWDNPPDLIHLSTSMCPLHRRKMIQKMTDLLSEENKKPLICVTTQLIEAGVDVSFGCVIRSLAGMDNSAQAAGRCNRSGEFHRICPVYIVELGEEKLGRLREIQDSKDASRQLLYMMERCGEEDFLSPESMTEFFDILFKTVLASDADRLSYPLEREEDTLLNLISKNDKNTALLEPTKRKAKKYSMQAFKTAGENFHVIDEITRDVFVPFDDDAKKLLGLLDSELSPADALGYIRQAQKYIVGIYPNLWQKLSDAHAIDELKNGGYRLKDEYYSKEFGITEEPSEMPLLRY